MVGLIADRRLPRPASGCSHAKLPVTAPLIANEPLERDARQARPHRSAIHAYEPNPATFRLLGVNARAYPQIRCHQLVVYAS
jgi:hypothetical protein